MKILRWVIVLAVFTLALSISAGSVTAAGSSPVGAPYVDNGTHTIPAKASTWYRFEYDGSHSQILVRLVDAKDRGLRFQIFAPTQMGDWWNQDPVGAGNVQNNDLIWSGNSHEGGAWYVQVINDNPAPMPFQLTVTGEDVSFLPTLPVKQESPNAVVVSPENIDPNKAFFVDPAAKVIPGNTTLWYRFAYDGTRDQVILKIPNGWENNLRFEIHTPSQMTRWWDSSIKPIGQGSPSDKDLVWSGNSIEAGWWYVQVINDNPHNVGFAFQVQYLERISQPD